MPHRRREVNSERSEREKTSGRSARLGAATAQSHCTPVPRCAPLLESSAFEFGFEFTLPGTADVRPAAGADGDGSTAAATAAVAATEASG